MSDRLACELCGEMMPLGEEMFKFHGYSGSCPKPPLPRDQVNLPDEELLAMWRSVQGANAGLTGPLIRFAGLVYRKVRGVDGGASGLAHEVSEPATPKEQALITSLERLIQQWRSTRAGSERWIAAHRACADDLEAVLSSLTREREP